MLNSYKPLRHLGAGGKAFGIDFFDYAVAFLLGLLVLRISKIPFDMKVGGYMLIGGWIGVFILLLLDRRLSKRLPRGWLLHWMTYNQQIRTHSAFDMEPMPEDIGDLTHGTRKDKP